MWYEGLLALDTWQHILIVLALALHDRLRDGLSPSLPAHRSLELHPALKHFFRFWLWLTTGMITREWTAIHRKHHAMWGDKIPTVPRSSA